MSQIGIKNVLTGSHLMIVPNHDHTNPVLASYHRREEEDLAADATPEPWMKRDLLLRGFTAAHVLHVALLPPAGQNPPQRPCFFVAV